MRQVRHIYSTCPLCRSFPFSPTEYTIHHVMMGDTCLGGTGSHLNGIPGTKYLSYLLFFLQESSYPILVCIENVIIIPTALLRRIYSRYIPVPRSNHHPQVLLLYHNYILYHSSVSKHFFLYPLYSTLYTLYSTL